MYNPQSINLSIHSSIHLSPSGMTFTLLLWIAANTGTWLLVCGFYLLFLGSANTPTLNAGLVILPLAIPTVATVQGLVLSRVFPIRLSSWVWATLIGGIIGMAVGMPMLMMFWPISIGIATGIGQWMVLRTVSQQIRWFLWAVCTIVGGGLGWLLSLELTPYLLTLLKSQLSLRLPSDSSFQLIVMGTVIEVVSSVVTGGAIYLLHKPYRQQLAQRAIAARESTPQESEIP